MFVPPTNRHAGAALDTAFTRDTTATTTNPLAPTHEDMQRRGWVPQRTGVDPVTGRRFTAYANPRSLPPPGRDYRPLADDMERPSRRLIDMQGNHHSSDPVITREPVEGREGHLHRDGTNFGHVIADHVRAADHDRALRTGGMRREAPEREFQGGNKAGFLGYQNLMRFIPFMPPTQRNTTKAHEKVKKVDPSAMAGGKRGDTMTQQPTQRPGLEQRAGQATTVHVDGGERAPARTANNRADEIRDLTGQRAKTELDRSMQTHQGLRQDQQSQLNVPMRLATKTRDVGRQTEGHAGGIQRTVDTRPQPMGLASLTSTARGMIQRVTETLTSGRKSDTSDRAVPDREGLERLKYEQRRTGATDLGRGVVGKPARLDTTKSEELAQLPLAGSRGFDQGETGSLGLANARAAARTNHLSDAEIAALVQHTTMRPLHAALV
jgi:hypothetical protein